VPWYNTVGGSAGIGLAAGAGLVLVCGACLFFRRTARAKGEAEWQEVRRRGGKRSNAGLDLGDTASVSPVLSELLLASGGGGGGGGSGRQAVSGAAASGAQSAPGSSLRRAFAEGDVHASRGSQATGISSLTGVSSLGAWVGRDEQAPVFF
jgi:hypothetical protein